MADIVEASGIEVDEAVLDPTGFTPLNFDPKASQLPGNLTPAPDLPSMRPRGSMRLNRERLTRGLVGAMLTMVLFSTTLFGVARHFAG
jgi:hypothetical protein